MNAYTTRFFARCPSNQIRIDYSLRIETYEMLGVEDILTALDEVDEGYHEEIADQMFARFGGIQKLTADHHGVTIETIRSK